MNSNSVALPVQVPKNSPVANVFTTTSSACGGGLNSIAETFFVRVAINPMRSWKANGIIGVPVYTN